MKIRELIFMVMDELKNSSDDSYFTEDHIIFLANKYRSFLLKQRYGTDIKKTIPESNYQLICLPLQEIEFEESFCYTGPRLVSSVELPTIMSFGTKRIFSEVDFTTIHMTLVSRDRFNYVGNDPWLKNIIYATIGPDYRLYLKSSNPQHLYLQNIQINAIFEDFLKASELELSNNVCQEGEDCTIIPLIDREFPIEAALVPPLIELIVKKLIPALYKPEDSSNNASDDLSKVQVK